jgi:hypothetical protein
MKYAAVKNTHGERTVRSLAKMTITDTAVTISIRISRWASALGPKAARSSWDLSLLESGPVIVCARRTGADSS